MSHINVNEYIPILCNKLIDCSTYNIYNIGISEMNFIIDTNFQGPLSNYSKICINKVNLTYDDILFLSFNNFVYIDGRIIFLRGINNSKIKFGNAYFNNSYYGIGIINQVCKECSWNDCVNAKICGNNLQSLHVINPQIYISGTIDNQEFTGHAVLPLSPIQISQFGIDSNSLYCQNLCLPISTEKFILYVNYENLLNIDCVIPLPETFVSNTFSANVESELCVKTELSSIINNGLVSYGHKI